MCRVVGYLGQRARVDSILLTPPHSLERQSYAARELQSSVVSADGWGFAWYLSGEREPCAYVSSLPIWADRNRLSLGRGLTSHAIVGAVRSATDAATHGTLSTQPYVFEDLSFLHNGYATPLTVALRRELRGALRDATYGLVRSETDSEYLFALIADEWLARKESAPHHRLEQALTVGAARFSDIAEAQGARVIASVIVTDGTRLVALRTHRGAEPAPSLYVAQSVSQVRVASEPLERSSAWVPLAEGQAYSFELRGAEVVGGCVGLREVAS